MKARSRDDRMARVRAAVLEHMRSGQVDQRLARDEVLRRHADLMPELEHELRKAEIIEKGRLQSQGDSTESEIPIPNEPSLGLRGDSIPGYEIIRRVHRGGQGVVFEGFQKATQRHVAIKVLDEVELTGRHERSRFEREVRILGALQHPSIVTIHDSGTVDGRFYFVMDYIDGEPLDVYMGRIGRPLDETLRLFQQICEAVHAAHLRGIIHRDLKPGNIRVDRQGRPCILDFGLAKLRRGDADGTATVTAPGQFVGSLPWASPEQVQGAPERIDLRTDVYSLGVILYQMLTGRFPYAVTGGTHEIMETILRAEPIRSSSIRGDINNEIETIVQKCLNKEPPRRYQSAGDLAQDIGRYLTGQPIEAKRDSTWYVLKKTACRHKVPLAFGCVLMLTVAGFAAAMTVLYRRAAREAQTNRRLADRLLTLFTFPVEESRSGYVPIREFLHRHAESVARELNDNPRALAEFTRFVANWSQSVEPEQGVIWATRLIQLHKEVLHSEPRAIAADMRFLAEALASAGRNADAERCYEEAIATARATSQGPDALLASLLASYAGFVGYRLGDQERGLALKKEALEILRALHPTDHAGLAAGIGAMAGYLHDMARFPEAEAYYREALAMWQRLNQEHYVWSTTLWIGALYKDTQRYGPAQSHIRDALDYFRGRYGEHGRDTAGAYQLLAKLYADMGDWSEAETTCRIALSRTREHFDPETEPVTTMMTELGRILFHQSRYGEAESILRESWTIQQRRLPETNWERAKTGTLLGAALAGLDRFQEAEPLLVDNFPIIRDNRKPRHRRTREALERVIFLYDRWGRPEKAAEWRAQLGQ